MKKKITVLHDLTLTTLFKGFYLKMIGEDVYYNRNSSGYLFKIIMRVPAIQGIIQKWIREFKPVKSLSEYPESHYKIEDATIKLTESFFQKYSIGESLSCKAYKRHYGTTKFDNIIKNALALKIRNFLSFLYFIECVDYEHKTIILNRQLLYQYVLENYQIKNIRIDWMRHGKPKVIEAGVLIFLLIYELLNFLNKQSISFVSPQKAKYKICFRAAHPPFEEGLLRNDLFIDETGFQPCEVLFYLEKGWGKGVVELFQRKKYNYVILDDLKIPLKELPTLIKDYFLLSCYALFLSLFDFRWFTCSILVNNYSKLALKSRLDLLNYYYSFSMVLSCHSLRIDMLIPSILFKRYNCKYAIYHFGTALSRSRLTAFAYQNANLFFSWGKDIVLPYEKTHDFDLIICTGFWGKKEYQKLVLKRDLLKERIPGLSKEDKIVIFYDLPYYNKTTVFSKSTLLKFLNMALSCADLPNVSVIIKSKNKPDQSNRDLRFFSVKNMTHFNSLWKQISDRENIFLLETSEYWDPLQTIAISDINVTLDMTSPSSMAIICGEIGLFYNITDESVFHPLFPKYKNTLIFNDTELLLSKIKEYLETGVNIHDLIDGDDIRGFDEYLDFNGMKRFYEAVNVEIEKTVDRTELLRSNKTWIRNYKL